MILKMKKRRTLIKTFRKRQRKRQRNSLKRFGMKMLPRIYHNKSKIIINLQKRPTKKISVKPAKKKVASFKRSQKSSVLFTG